MKARLALILILGAILGLPLEAAPEKTVSSSEQFIVHGSTLPVRSGVASLAEGVREALVKEVGPGPISSETGKPAEAHPIVIELHDAGSDSMRAEFRILDDGFRLQLDVYLSRGIDREAMERQLLELLIYERGLRDRDPASVPRRLFIPPWLVDGLREAMKWRAQEADRDLYKVLFERNAVVPVGELLDLEKVTDLDGASRVSYRISAGALVMGLLSQDGGRGAMGELLTAAATHEGDIRVLLRRFFPGMNLGEKSLKKWWALQLARMAEPDVLSTLTIQETEERLAEILVLRLTLGDEEETTMEIHPEHYRDLLAFPLEKRKEALEVLVSEANTYYVRAFPAYRKIIEEYLRILAELAHDRDENVDERLEELSLARRVLAVRGEELADLLDWYQITSAREVSGEFGDYRELKKRLDAEGGRVRGGGPISRYLDQVEVLFAHE